ncbi:MAG: ABC transporter permease subunit, partial [Clostridiales bacterium]|nr:ABC transporter permease subunit [Clostridiales bacterium]
IPILLVISAFIKISHPVMLSLVIAFLSWAQLCRVVRAQIMSLKNREFITICEVMGFKKLYIIFVEMLPNVVSYLAIAFIQGMQQAINMSTLLILMGFSPFTVTHWGTIQATATAAAAGAFSPKTLLYLFSPMVCFSLLSTACVLFASGLDEALNPRLRGH